MTMGDKDDNIFNRKAELYLIKDGEIKQLGKVVEKSTIIGSEDGYDCVPTKDSFSFSCEMPCLSKWFEDNHDLKPIREAQDMLTQLRNYKAIWNKYYGFGMRKERRRIERNFKKLAQRFVIHCRLYGITVKQTSHD